MNRVEQLHHLLNQKVGPEHAMRDQVSYAVAVPVFDRRVPSTHRFSSGIPRRTPTLRS
jgi:hypothetical protein